MAKAREIVALTAACAAGAIYLYAGALKLWRPDLLLTDILSYQLVPYRLAFFAAYLLPAVEVVAGVAIFIRRFRAEASLVLLTLTLVFTLALVTAWVRGLDITCGCFGRSDVKANYPLLVARDLAIALACGLAFALSRPRLSKD